MTPASASAPISSPGRTCSRRGSRPARRHAARIRSRLARIRPASRPWIRPAIRLPPDEPAWRPVSGPSPRCEKNSSGLQRVQRSLISTRSTPDRDRAAVRATSGRSSIRPTAIPSPRKAKALRTSSPTSKQQGPIPGPTLASVASTALRPASTTRRPGRASRHAAWPRRSAPRYGDRQAVGDEDEERQAGFAGVVAVDLGRIEPGRRRRAPATAALVSDDRRRREPGGRSRPDRGRARGPRRPSSPVIAHRVAQSIAGQHAEVEPVPRRALTPPRGW